MEPVATKIEQIAKQLAFESWPKAFPYGRDRWVQENWTSFIQKAKEEKDRWNPLKPR